MLKILVTDGPYKNTLAVLRSLGRGHNVVVTSPLPAAVTLSSYSHYCRGTRRIRAETRDADQYAEELANVLSRERFDLLIPVGLNSYLAASKHKKELEALTRLVVVDYDTMRTAYLRDEAIGLAERAGVPVPKTSPVVPGKPPCNEIYPVYIKASNIVGSAVRCAGPREVEVAVASLAARGGTGIVAQECVGGFGCGFFGVYDHGTMVAHFMHRRIVEFPAAGGPSAVAESFFDTRLFRYGKSLCDALEWHGPIMAEFKYDQVCDDFKLIEINPKLWGSLDLTIAAGVDVPGILVRIALGETVADTPPYQYVRYRWAFPDEWLALMSASFSFRELARFVRTGKAKTSLDFSDPLPTLAQVTRGLLQGGWEFAKHRRPLRGYPNEN